MAKSVLDLKIVLMASVAVPAVGAAVPGEEVEDSGRGGDGGGEECKAGQGGEGELHFEGWLVGLGLIGKCGAESGC